MFKISAIKRVGLRVPVGLYCKLEEISKSYGIPVASLVNFIVAQWVDNQIYVRDRLISELRDVVIECGKGGNVGG